MANDMDDMAAHFRNAQHALILVSGRLDGLENTASRLQLTKAVTDLSVSLSNASLYVVAENETLSDARENAVTGAVETLVHTLAAVAERSDQPITLPFKCKDDHDRCMAAATDGKARVLCAVVFAICLAQGFKIG
jgi:hypothetical protein